MTEQPRARRQVRTGVVGDPQQVAAERRAERQRSSWQSMVISLLVVLGVVLVALLIVPRTNSVEQPPVSVPQGAVAAREQVHFDPAVPRGLPDGWRATSVRTVRSTADVVTWHAGYQTPADQYAAVEQGQDAPPEWVTAETNRAPTTGTLALRGRSWTKYVRADKTQNSLVSTSGGVTTVVTGTAGFAELSTLVDSLQPLP